MRTGGEGGIRTHERREGSPVFKSDDTRDNGTQARVTALVPSNLGHCLLPGKPAQTRPVQLACNLEIVDYCVSAGIARRAASTRPDTPGTAVPRWPSQAVPAALRDKNGRLDLSYIRIYNI